MRLTDTDVRNALVGHNGLHIREVEVDETRHIDEIRDALHCLLEHFVRLAESLRHRGAAIHNLKELIVRNHNEGVDRILEMLDARERVVHALLALKVKRLGHDTDREYPHLFCDARNDRCRTGTGSAAHAAGHKDHVRILQRFRQIFGALLRRFFADLRLCAGTEAARKLLSDLHDGRGLAELERLLIGVDADKLYPFDVLVDHAVHCIVACAANADYDDLCSIIVFVQFDL